MRSRRDYTATVAECLDPPMRYRPGVLSALRAYKAMRPWSGDREAKLRALNYALAGVYGIPEPHLVLQHGESLRSYYTPAANQITLTGFSVVTFLHEFAHALGRGEHGACRWSLQLFHRVFPREFARCEQHEHTLCRNRALGARGPSDIQTPKTIGGSMTTATLTKAERTELDKLLTDYDQARSALADKLEEIVNKWTDAASDRSESWQESEAGLNAHSRIDSLQAILDELPETPIIDFEELS